MSYAVVTPYFEESLDVLRRCWSSVVAQASDVRHIFVGDGRAREIDGWERVTHLRLPVHCADSGATPRGIGSALAWAIDDVEGLLYLDADNWFEPNHLEEMIATQKQSAADVVTCPRRLLRPDGSVLGICDESDGEKFNDTNCFLFMRSASRLTLTWMGQPKRMALWCDRLVWAEVRASPLRLARSRQPSVNYVTLVASHYTSRGETPPPNARNAVRVGDEVIHFRS